MALRVSSLMKPRGIWWHALGKDEKLWAALVVIWGFAMFAIIGFVWPVVGKSQNNIKSYRIEPTEYRAKVDQFIQRHRTGELGGVPVVAPPPGSDIFLEAFAFGWRPVVELKRGQTYKLLLSSRDVQHGFSLVMPRHSINYQVLPGFVTEIELTPEKSGDYPVVCNEYCGLGHHVMLGRIVVKD